MRASGRINASSIAARPLASARKAHAAVEWVRNVDCPIHQKGSMRNTWVDVISILPLPRFEKLRPSGPP
jgi:hypothetical protein